MANILTPAEVRAIVTPNVRFDVGYYSTNIEYAQQLFLKPIMCEAFYNDFVAQIGALPVLYQLLNDTYIKYIVAYGSALVSYKKDLTPQTDNQGVMTNSTQYTKQADPQLIKGSLMQLADMLTNYRIDFATYLLENPTDFPLFDSDTSVLSLELRDFIKY